MIKKLTVVVALLTVGFLSSSVAQTTYSLKSYKVVVKGSSNVHDWTAEVKKMGITSSFNVTDGALVGINTTNVDIDVATLKASEGSIMDGKMRDALNAEKFPKITFSMSNATFPTSSATEFTSTVTGNLTISGTTVKVSLPVKVRTLANGEIEISGAQKFKMTSFKITPPTAMFGAMKTADDITINYLVTLKKG